MSYVTLNVLLVLVHVLSTVEVEQGAPSEVSRSCQDPSTPAVCQPSSRSGSKTSLKQNSGNAGLALLQSSYSTRQHVVSEVEDVPYRNEFDVPMHESVGQVVHSNATNILRPTLPAHEAAATSDSGQRVFHTFASALLSKSAKIRIQHGVNSNVFIGLAIGSFAIVLLTIWLIFPYDSTAASRATVPGSSVRAGVNEGKQFTPSNASIARNEGGDYPSNLTGRSGSIVVKGTSSLSLCMSARPVGEYFCADLVVPGACECVLLVPIRSKNFKSFDIADMNGNIVLHLEQQPGDVLHHSTSRSAGMSAAMRLGQRDQVATLGESKRLLLSTSYGDVLAQCRAARPSAPPDVPLGQAEFHLLRATGDFFANLVRVETPEGHPQYALSHVAGQSRMFFWGAFGDHCVNVTDDSGRLLATADTQLSPVEFDSSGLYYRLRVAPMMDVGLILCSLLSIEYLSSAIVE